MIVYSSNNGILDTDKYLRYDTGGNSTIYKKQNEDILFKVYRIDACMKYRITKKTFEMLKNYSIPNLVELYDYYYLYNQRINRILPIDAYTMKLISDKKVKLIDMDRNYMIDVLKQLEETLKKLSEKKIMIGDPHKDNILFHENGVTLIDLDQFMRINFFSKSYVYNFNKVGLMYGISSKLQKEFKEVYSDLVIPNYYAKEGTSISEDFKYLLEEQKVGDSIKKHCYSLK